MTPRERFMSALDRKPVPGLVPHFELVFFLTMEAFGKVHPSQRAFHQWDQMSDTERQLHRVDQAQLYIDTAEKYGHSAIFVHPNPGSLEEQKRLLDEIRRLSGDKYFLMQHGDPTYAIPDGAGMEEMSLKMVEEPDFMVDQAKRWTEGALEHGHKLKEHGALDGFALCSDYCFNSGPFLPLSWFDQFVLPFLTQVTKGYREMGFYTIKHTDGNIMPILDRLVESGPHALHSLDPQGGVDMAEVVRLAGDKVCLIGNVDCGKLQTGTEEECIESARYSLNEGMKAPGYIFSTSNCVYTGLPLARYDLILDVWRKEGIRQ